MLWTTWCDNPPWREPLEYFDRTALLNFRPHVLEDMQRAKIDQYFLLGGQLNALKWRTYEPEAVYSNVEGMVMRRLGA